MTSADLLAVHVVDLLRDIEWSASIWTDTPVCPACGATRDGLPAYKDNPVELPLTHRDGCALKACLAEALAAASLEYIATPAKGRTLTIGGAVVDIIDCDG